MLLLNNLNPLESTIGFHLIIKEHWKMTGGNATTVAMILLCSMAQAVQRKERECVHHVNVIDHSPLRMC